VCNPPSSQHPIAFASGFTGFTDKAISQNVRLLGYVQKEISNDVALSTQMVGFAQPKSTQTFRGKWQLKFEAYLPNMKNTKGNDIMKQGESKRVI
jgi:hypothetical protein